MPTGGFFKATAQASRVPEPSKKRKVELPHESASTPQIPKQRTTRETVRETSYEKPLRPSQKFWTEKSRCHYDREGSDSEQSGSGEGLTVSEEETNEPWGDPHTYRLAQFIEESTMNERDIYALLRLLRDEEFEKDEVHYEALRSHFTEYGL